MPHDDPRVAGDGPAPLIAPGPVTVRARDPWNDTGIDLTAGTTYRLRAEGEWIDLLIRSGPEGFPSRGWLMRRLEPRRRVPDRPWFELIGCIGSADAGRFPIGREGTITPRTSGRLFCFANDLPRMYWNNRGAVELHVTPMS